MPRYEICIAVEKQYVVIVEADSEKQAENIARSIPTEKLGNCDETEVSVYIWNEVEAYKGHIYTINDADKDWYNYLTGEA